MRAARRAFLDDVAHHARHIRCNGGGDGLRRFLSIAVETPNEITRTISDFEGGVRDDRLALVREGRIGHRMFGDVDLVRTDRKRRRIGQRCLDAHFARGCHDHGASRFGAALAAHRDGQLHGNDVDRTCNGLSERDRSRIGVTIVLRTPIADANRAVDDDRFWCVAVHQRGGIDIRFER